MGGCARSCSKYSRIFGCLRYGHRRVIRVGAGDGVHLERRVFRRRRGLLPRGDQFRSWRIGLHLPS